MPTARLAVIKPSEHGAPYTYKALADPGGPLTAGYPLGWVLVPTRTIGRRSIPELSAEERARESLRALAARYGYVATF